MPVNVGFIGTGHISTAHLRAFRELHGVEVAAVCSRTPENVAAYASRYGIPHAFTDYRDVLARENIDAVVVATPNDTHAPIASAALRARKHVLLEKPMALNAAQARQLVELAETTDKVLMVGMCRRFTEKARALRELVARGELGDIYYARTGYIRRWGNPGGWFSRKDRAGGGPVIDLGVHIIDLVRFLVGSPTATTVSAAVFSKLGMRPPVKGVTKYMAATYDDYSDVEDGATALIRFANGMTLVFETSWVQNIKADRMYLELYGDRAGAQLAPDFELYSSVGSYMADVKPIIEADFNSTARAFRRQAEHFIECITQGTPCQSPARDGLEVMKIIDAIYESGRLDREVKVEA